MAACRNSVVPQVPPITDCNSSKTICAKDLAATLHALCGFTSGQLQSGPQARTPVNGWSTIGVWLPGAHNLAYFHFKGSDLYILRQMVQTKIQKG